MDLAKVQIKPLAGESDLQVWKYRMKFILKCHAGALELVQGTLVKPEIPTAGAEEPECTATFGLMSVDEEVYASEILSDTWYIDNDASKHITMNDKFIAFEKFQSSHGITPAKGKVLPALGKGTLPTVTVVMKKQFKVLKDV
ncbi:hypothetical protein AVEN_114895-1 [Araneus ventricosus]|uniref:Retrovirus-related Pol polyprotein from transposon TNT 1-94-like beta-barrel domain-containing protein n=1 Tax=Araneus ventricosus TaxID=182803 RepID=A0A4Y2S967_ARAVE|nr:hypothetical protein AVEN_114895-1 [Araneus ventricosus]